MNNEKSKKSKKFDKLAKMCQEKKLNFFLGWTVMGKYSVEIYTGYSSGSYRVEFFSDGYLKKNDAIKKAIKHMKKFNNREVSTLGTPQY